MTQVIYAHSELWDSAEMPDFMKSRMGCEAVGLVLPITLNKIIEHVLTMISARNSETEAPGVGLQ